MVVYTMSTVTSEKIVHDNTTYYWSYNPPNWPRWSGLELFRVTNGTVDKIFPTSTGWLAGSLAFIYDHGGYDLYRRIFYAKQSLVSMSTEFRKQLDDFDSVIGSDIRKITVGYDTVYSTGQDDSKRNSVYLLSQLHLHKTVTLYCEGLECVIQYLGPDVPFPYKIYYISRYFSCMNESEYNEQCISWKGFCKATKNNLIQLSKEQFDTAKKEHNKECKRLAALYGPHHLQNIDKIDKYGRRSMFM